MNKIELLDYFINNWWSLTWRLLIIITLITFIVAYIIRLNNFNTFKANKEGIEIGSGDNKEFHYREWYYGPLP